MFNSSRHVAIYLGGSLKLTGSENNVLNTDARESVLGTEHMGTRRLVANSEVQCADLVETEGASRVLDVVEGRVLPDPGVGTAAGEEVHGVCSHQGELATGGLDEVAALVHGDELVVGIDAATNRGIVSSGLAGGKVVPGVVGDIVCSRGGVELKKVNGTSVGRDLDAHGVTARRMRPVGSAVGVYVAAKDSD